MNTPPVASARFVLPNIHIIRHGQSLHNIERGYPHRDPPLTEKGEEDAKCIRICVPCSRDGDSPDLILISPMTRAIQTAILAFPSIFQSHTVKAEVQIWPELREAHDANCNKGLSRTDLTHKFSSMGIGMGMGIGIGMGFDFDFSECPPEWDHHPPHTIEGATLRAEAVRKRLETVAMSGRYQDIALVTHRGFIAFLVSGDRFDVCETRSYRFATTDEAGNDMLRFRTNVDTGERQDFGPTLLVPLDS